MPIDRDAHLRGSEVRLWALVAERCQPDADKEAIDRRIWDLFGEEWAVMFTDLAGFSGSVAEYGIIHFLQVLHEHKALLLPIVAAHDGILVKVEADSCLIIFKRASSALRCAIAMQRATGPHNRTRAAAEHVLLCIGIGHGKILRVGDVDVYGQQVNAASKLGEDTARAHQILVTEAALAAIGPLDEGITSAPIDHPVAGSQSNFRIDYE